MLNKCVLAPHLLKKSQEELPFFRCRNIFYVNTWDLEVQAVDKLSLRRRTHGNTSRRKGYTGLGLYFGSAFDCQLESVGCYSGSSEQWLGGQEEEEHRANEQHGGLERWLASRRIGWRTRTLEEEMVSLYDVGPLSMWWKQRWGHTNKSAWIADWIKRRRGRRTSEGHWLHFKPT